MDASENILSLLGSTADMRLTSLQTYKCFTSMELSYKILSISLKRVIYKHLEAL